MLRFPWYSLTSWASPLSTFLRAAPDLRGVAGSNPAEGAKRQNHRWTSSRPGQAADSAAKLLASPLDDLERLAHLFKEGLITDEKYVAMKSKLIAGLDSP